MKLRVTNKTRDTILGDSVDIADTSSKRRAGLLKHTGLRPGQGLWIVPCESVHTFFMKFAIDLVYIDRARKVQKVQSAVPPWRLSLCLRAHSIIELPAGVAEKSRTRPGDQLQIDELC